MATAPIAFKSPIKFEMRGTRKLRQELYRIAQQAPDKAKIALQDEAKRQVDLAMSKTPKKTGALRRSRRVGTAYQDGIDLVVPFGFGTDEKTAQYAVVQHQKHWKHTRGQRRYLADAVYNSRGRMVRRLAKDLKIR